MDGGKSAEKRYKKIVKARKKFLNEFGVTSSEYDSQANHLENIQVISI